MPSARQYTMEGAAIPGRIIGGPGSLARLEGQLEALGVERALVLCGPGVAGAGLHERVAGAGGGRVAAVFTGMAPHSPLDSVLAARNRAREVEADALISVGGGSSHDGAKWTALLLAEGGEALEPFKILPDGKGGVRVPTLSRPKLPIVTVPTTFSAAEVLGGGAFTDRAARTKAIVIDPHLVPRCVILDPELAAVTPRRVLLASGMNTIHHCVEALYSREAQPLSDALAGEALRRLGRSLPRLAGDLPREELMVVLSDLMSASALSGMAYAQSWLGIGHAVCHILGGRYGISHGVANAIILPRAIAFNRDAAREPLARAAEAFGWSPTAAAEPAGWLVERVSELRERFGIPGRLREVGVPREELPRIVEETLEDPQVVFNPRPVTPEGLAGLLAEAW